MSIYLETLPLAAYFFGSAGGLTGALLGLDSGARDGLVQGKYLGYTTTGFETNDIYEWKDPHNKAQRFIKIITFTAAGTISGAATGVAIGWGLDFTVRTTLVGLKTLADLTIQVAPLAANQVISLGANVVKEVASHPVGIAIVAGAIAPFVLLMVCASRHH